jgi:hypothetical protein
MRTQERGSSLHAVLVVLVLVGALIAAAPQISALLMRTVGAALRVRENESEVVSKALESLSVPALGWRIESRLVSSRRVPATAITVLGPVAHGEILDLELESPRIPYVCPATALLQEQLFAYNETSAYSAFTCSAQSAVRLVRSTEVQSNFSAPQLEVITDIPITIVVAGWLKLSSLSLQRKARILVGGDVTIEEIHLQDGADLRIHSATGTVEVTRAIGKGSLLISGRAQPPAALFGMKESLQVLPQSKVRLLGIRRLTDSG